MQAMLSIIISGVEMAYQHRAEIGQAVGLIKDLRALQTSSAGQVVEKDVIALFHKHQVDPNEVAAIMNDHRSDTDVADKLERTAEAGGGAL